MAESDEIPQRFVGPMGTLVNRRPQQRAMQFQVAEVQIRIVLVLHSIDTEAELPIPILDLDDVGDRLDVRLADTMFSYAVSSFSENRRSPL